MQRASREEQERATHFLIVSKGKDPIQNALEAIPPAKNVAVPLLTFHLLSSGTALNLRIMIS